MVRATSIGQGSKPQPLRRQIGTSSPAMAKVGIARPMLSTQVADSSPRR